MARSLSLVPLAQLSLLAGQEHGRTIPLTDVQPNVFAIFPRAHSNPRRSRHNFRQRMAARDLTLVV
jgi:hypothetical protein